MVHLLDCQKNNINCGVPACKIVIRFFNFLQVPLHPGPARQLFLKFEGAGETVAPRFHHGGVLGSSS